jgi:hypothetical protein
LLVAAVAWVAIGHWKASSDVGAVVGLVISMIGTVVGAFFSIQVGAQGKIQAETARDKVETKASLALAAASSEYLDSVLGKLPE